MSSDWNLPGAQLPLAPEVCLAVGGYAARALAHRGIRTADAARAFIEPVLHPADWPLLDECAQTLLRAVRSQQTVLLRGEGSAAGIVAAALLKTALQKLGLTPRLSFVDSEVGDGALLVALGTAPVKRDGSAMVIDHHREPGWSADIPALNPLALPLGHPWRTLGRVGTTYMLAAALYAAFGLEGEQFLDLAAVGVVAEAVPLEGVHRALVHGGIARLAATERHGLRQLCFSHRAQLFRLAMKLDGLTHLEDARVAVELLITEDSEAAAEGLAAFERAYREQQLAGERTVEQAALQVESFDLKRVGALVLYHPDWRAIDLPLAAARLVERYDCTVALFAAGPSSATGFARAAGRADLLEALQAVAPLLDAHGGQPGAVWWQCSQERIPALRRALLRELTGHAGSGGRRATLVLDAETMLDVGQELDRVFAELERLAPFGPGHPRPLVVLRHCRPALTLSRDGKHLDCKIAHRTLRLRGGAEHRHEWQLDALDVAFEMEPWEASRLPWWGRVHEIRVAGDVPERRKLEPELLVEDCRTHPERAREYVCALVLACWPLLSADLASRLRAERPVLVVLAARPFPWPPIEQAVSALLGAWETGGDPFACGLPAALVERLSDSERSYGALSALVREVQAFQRWLDGASVEAIRHLCLRLRDER